MPVLLRMQPQCQVNHAPYVWHQPAGIRPQLGWPCKASVANHVSMLGPLSVRILCTHHVNFLMVQCAGYSGKMPSSRSTVKAADTSAVFACACVACSPF